LHGTAALTTTTSSFPTAPSLPINPETLTKLSIDHLFGTDYSEENELSHMSAIRSSLPELFSRMPSLIDLAFRNFSYSRTIFRRCLLGLRNSHHLKSLQFLDLYWNITLLIVEDLSKLSPTLERLVCEFESTIRIFEDDCVSATSPFDVSKLCSTLSPLQNLRALSLNHTIPASTPAIVRAIYPDSKLKYFGRLFEKLKKEDLAEFECVRGEYIDVVSDAVKCFGETFEGLEYVGVAVWESCQWVDGNEICILRVSDGIGDGKKGRVVGWRQESPNRHLGKFDIRF
jgi:hypothetical protein